MELPVGNRCHISTRAGTTGCRPASRHVSDLQPKYHSRSEAWYRAPQTAVRAIQFHGWSYRYSSAQQYNEAIVLARNANRAQDLSTSLHPGAHWKLNAAVLHRDDSYFAIY